MVRQKVAKRSAPQCCRRPVLPPGAATWCRSGADGWLLPPAGAATWCCHLVLPTGAADWCCRADCHRRSLDMPAIWAGKLC
ncbi:MAG: hypothetical protein FWF71_07785 [Actinomycetia bacterium]|nr:hypothetical protein [Actinomycetes bacterium]